MDPEQEHIQDPFKRFELYLRYQTTNDRGFHKCLADLMKLRAEKRQFEKDSERRAQRPVASPQSTDGFGSQNRTAAAAARITHSEPEASATTSCGFESQKRASTQTARYSHSEPEASAPPSAVNGFESQNLACDPLYEPEAHRHGAPTNHAPASQGQQG